MNWILFVTVIILTTLIFLLMDLGWVAQQQVLSKESFFSPDKLRGTDHRAAVGTLSCHPSVSTTGNSPIAGSYTCARKSISIPEAPPSLSKVLKQSRFGNQAMIMLGKLRKQIYVF